MEFVNKGLIVFEFTSLQINNVSNKQNSIFLIFTILYFQE